MSLLKLLSYSQGWEFAHRFSERIAHFLRKMSKLAIRSKNEQFAQSLIFGERPEGFAHGRSFLVNNLNESLMVAHFW